MSSRGQDPEHRGLTEKHRFPYDIEDRHSLSEAALDFIDGFDFIAPVSRTLYPSLTTRYNRTTLLEADSMSRITVDTDLECVAADGSSVTLPQVAVVETKTSGRPCPLDHLLWEFHHRPSKISKYGTGLAALTPTLPANKWNRVLRDYFPISPRSREGVTHHHYQRPLAVDLVAPIVAEPAARCSHQARCQMRTEGLPVLEGGRP